MYGLLVIHGMAVSVAFSDVNISFCYDPIVMKFGM